MTLAGVAVGLAVLAAAGATPVATRTVAATVAPTSTTLTTTTTTAPDPAEAMVQVVNAGTGVAGAAAALGERLTGLGYRTVDPTNTVDEALVESVVLHRPGFEDHARALAAELGLTGPTAVTSMPSDLSSRVKEPAAADVVVLLGSAQAG